MPMTPYYLQTTDEAAMWSALTEMGMVAEHEGERYITAEHSIIGHWYERTGGTDEEPVMEQLPGWHFNLLLAKRPPFSATAPTGVAYLTTQSPTEVTHDDHSNNTAL